MSKRKAATAALRNGGWIESLEERRLLSGGYVLGVVEQSSKPAAVHQHHHHHRQATAIQTAAWTAANSITASANGPISAPNFRVIESAGSSHPDASTSPTGFTPARLRHAYGMDAISFGSVVGDGSGQTIAIVDAYKAPNVASDLHAFDTQFGLNDPTLTILNENGTTTLPGTDPSGPGDSWALETSLDVEWAHVVAPKANILLIEANSPSDADLFKAVDTARRYAGVSAVSLSWGGSEFSGQSSYDSYLTTPAGHQGVTFLVSSGDSGAYSYNNTSVKAVEYPASSPNAVAVGGTFLSADSAGNYSSESGWGNGTSSGASGGSGGGISAYTTQPTYQKGVVTQSTTMRTLPDVSLDADPSSGAAVYDSYDSPGAPWIQVGGTSLAAPLWAGVMAIANQGRALNGLGSLDGASGTLPKLYSLPASDYHDVTTGNNGYAASAGYDLVTGRGTPIVNKVVADLAGTPQAPTPVIGSFILNPATVTVGGSTVLTASNVQETNGSISGVKFYRESNSIAGYQAGSDVLVGSGTQNGTTWALPLSTSGMTPGNYTYYAVATDAASVNSSPAAAALTINAPAPANDMFASAVALSGSTVSAFGTTVNATKEAGEPNHAGNTGGHSIWYSWTATTSGKVAVNTAGSSFDTLLAVYQGNSVSALTAVASNDDAPGVRTSALTFTAVAGTTYKIAVDGYNGASGNVALNLSQVAAPANDLFANAATITGTTLTWTGSSVGATKETGEPAHAGNAGGASIWLNWTAPVSRAVKLTTAASNFDTLLAVYTGSAVNALTRVASNDDAGNGVLTSSLTFNAVAGTTYRIAVDGYNGASGSVTVNVS